MLTVAFLKNALLIFYLTQRLENAAFNKNREKLLKCPCLYDRSNKKLGTHMLIFLNEEFDELVFKIE